MRKYSQVVLCVVCVLCALILPLNLLAQSQDGHNTVFRWSFIAMLSSDGQQEVIPITKDIDLRSGDHLQMMVELKSECNLYVLFLTSSGELYTLFHSGNYKMSRGRSIQEQKIYIPGRGSWLTLDDEVGREKVYLLASATPLSTLEDLVAEHDEVAEGGREALVKAIIEEIRVLRKKNMRFEVAAERPVQLGGTFRSAGETSDVIETYAQTYSANDFFSKSYTIDHQH